MDEKEEIVKLEKEIEDLDDTLDDLDDRGLLGDEYSEEVQDELKKKERELELLEKDNNA